MVDRAALDAGELTTRGGCAHLNKPFDGSLEAVHGDLADDVWKDAG